LGKKNNSGKPNYQPGGSEVIGGKTHSRRFRDIDFASCSLLRETRLKVLLTDCKTVVVKVADPQRYPQHTELVWEMENEENEAVIYKLLAQRGCPDVAPQFIGYGEISHAPSLAVEAESPSFDAIGLENVSPALRSSAIAALGRMHRVARVGHGDLRLANIVRCRRDPNLAKLIDFGRAFKPQTTVVAAVAVEITVGH
jgi:hypothetical protein